MQRPEFELIDWIREKVRDRGAVQLGIGDDAAIMQSSGRSLVAVDMLMEGVHFTFPEATPQLAGRKALAVNLSDIAAMAGRATAAFVAVALPRSRGMQFAQQVHEGLIELADEHNVVLAGGDTNTWKGPLVISVTVLGEPLMAEPVCRSGAQPGDWVFVTGALGGSLPSGRHLTFPPRLDEARQISELVPINSMIDLSDGLAADIHHILKASSVGAVLYESDIPLTDAGRNSQDNRSPLEHALSDGEDFELLFTVSAEQGKKLLSAWKSKTPISHIGEIIDGSGCQLKQTNGQLKLLEPIGWTHRFSNDT